MLRARPPSRCPTGSSPGRRPCCRSTSECAARVVLGAALVATHWRSRSAPHDGARRATAWLAFPLLYGKILFLGYAPFLTGVPLWLLGTALADRHFTGRGLRMGARHRRGRDLLRARVAGPRAHGLRCACSPRFHRPPLRRLAALAPFVLLLAYWIAVTATDPTMRATPDHPSTLGVVFETPGEALGHLPAFPLRGPPRPRGRRALHGAPRDLVRARDRPT
jgi:hypothetical protein